MKLVKSTLYPVYTIKQTSSWLDEPARRASFIVQTGYYGRSLFIKRVSVCACLQAWCQVTDRWVYHVAASVIVVRGSRIVRRQTVTTMTRVCRPREELLCPVNASLPALLTPARHTTHTHWSVMSS